MLECKCKCHLHHDSDDERGEDDEEDAEIVVIEALSDFIPAMARVLLGGILPTYFNFINNLQIIRLRLTILKIIRIDDDLH